MTEDPATDLDGILDALHGDRKAVLSSQLRSIEEEVVERRLIATDTTLVVHDEVHELTNELLNLPEGQRQERIMLAREQRGLRREVRDELRNAWKEVQALRQEERLVEKELLQAVKQHDRNKDLGG
jgi:hypothetical protein